MFEPSSEPRHTDAVVAKSAAGHFRRQRSRMQTHKIPYCLPKVDSSRDCLVVKRPNGIYSHCMCHEKHTPGLSNKNIQKDARMVLFVLIKTLPTFWAERDAIVETFIRFPSSKCLDTVCVQDIMCSELCGTRKHNQFETNT